MIQGAVLEMASERARISINLSDVASSPLLWQLIERQKELQRKNMFSNDKLRTGTDLEKWMEKEIPHYLASSFTVQ